jgi:hypothetical protein
MAVGTVGSYSRVVRTVAAICGFEENDVIMGGEVLPVMQSREEAGAGASIGLPPAFALPLESRPSRCL